MKKLALARPRREKISACALFSGFLLASAEFFMSDEEKIFAIASVKATNCGAGAQFVSFTGAIALFSLRGGQMDSSGPALFAPAQLVALVSHGRRKECALWRGDVPAQCGPTDA